jgi:hypothetical protein
MRLFVGPRPRKKVAVTKKLILVVSALTMLLVTASVALAQTESVSYVGFITNISGAEVLVEEDPQDPVVGGVGSNKGYFTVTDETEIFRLVGGDALAPATFEDLESGQLVAATYSGPILESYPTQGGAESIVILADAGDEPLCNIPEGCDFDSVTEVPAGGAEDVQYDSGV